MYYFL
jgi:hypothetical protein